ncbi:MAG: hypothetical protein WDO74_34015 [Pseudomonadota bacterium]
MTRAREQARIFGPDLAIIDATASGARELVEALLKDLQVEPLPLLVIAELYQPRGRRRVHRSGRRAGVGQAGQYGNTAAYGGRVAGAER